MAKRKRLSPARMTETPLEVKSGQPPRASLAARPPIADVAHDAAAAAALSEVAAELTAARSEERLIQRLPLDAIDAEHLVRDRATLDREELDVLIESIEQRGQQTAIEVTDLGEGRYGLISGFRRLVALQMISLQAERPLTALAIVRHPHDAAGAYQAMVEENEIRASLSIYEKGRIVARATDEGVYRTDRVALATLFAAVPRARRSKIGSLVGVVRALDDVLEFPTALTEKLGLALARRLEEDPAFVETLTNRLRDALPQSAEAEIAVITALLGKDTAPRELDMTGPRKRPAPRPQGSAPRDSLTRAVVPGLEMTMQPNGSVLLQGAKLCEADFVTRLEEALKSLE